MRKVCTAVLSGLLLIGCSENTLKVQNRSPDVNITLNFRAKEYSLPAGSSDVLITDIPNGTYAYGTVYSPAVANIQTTPGDGLSGQITFQRGSTEALLIYGSFAKWDSAAQKWNVTVWAQKSTNDPVGIITSP